MGLVTDRSRRPGVVAPALVLVLLATLVALLPVAAPARATAGGAAGTTSGQPGARPPDLTLALRDAWWQQNGQRPDTGADAGEGMGPTTSYVAAAGSTVTARPTSPGAHDGWRYPDHAEVHRTCSSRICVHRVDRGTHASTAAWAAQTLRHLERSWTRLVDQLGFRAPAEDGQSGGDARFDVYLANVSRSSHYGFCAPDTMVPGQTHRASAYCVLDNDMASFPGKPAANLAVTAAHELFHAIQFNTDLAEDTWFMEATATWGETQVFPRRAANRAYLRDGQLGMPQRPLDSQAGMYGNWLFVHWLTQRYGIRAVRDIWHRLDATTGRANEWSLQGISRYVASRGHTWPATYRAFAVANAFPARHRGLSGLGRFRAERPDARIALGPGKSRAKPQQRRTLRLDHLTSGTAVLTVRPRAKGRRVAVSLRTGRAKRTDATLVLVRRDGTRKRVALTPGRKGRASARFNSAKVRRAVVVVANTSHVYRRCGQASGWACGGDPLHDGTRVRIRARLLG